MNRVNTAAMAFCLLAVLPRAASAQNSEYGPRVSVSFRSLELAVTIGILIAETSA